MIESDRQNTLFVICSINITDIEDQMSDRICYASTNGDLFLSSWPMDYNGKWLLPATLYAFI